MMQSIHALNQLPLGKLSINILVKITKNKKLTLIQIIRSPLQLVTLIVF